MSVIMAINVYKLKVQALQDKLYRAAKQSLDRKFGALYDKLYRKDILWMSWEKVRSNDGAPGIDNRAQLSVVSHHQIKLYLINLRSASEHDRLSVYRFLFHSLSYDVPL